MCIFIKTLKESSLPRQQEHAICLYPDPGEATARFSIQLDFLTLEDGTDRLSRNVGTESPLSAA